MATERAKASPDPCVALVDEAYDLTRWLGVGPQAAPGVIVAAAGEAAARTWDEARGLEVALLGTVAARAMAVRPRSCFRVPPRLSPRALHPSSTSLAPAASVDALARAARDVLALLPPDDAAVALLSVRYELDPGEVAWLLSMSRRRAGELLERARNGFAGTAGALVLWNRGEPRCADLRELASLTGIERLGQSAARLFVDHAERCRVCSAELWKVTEVLSALATAPAEATPPEVAARVRDSVASLTSRGLRT